MNCLGKQLLIREKLLCKFNFNKLSCINGLTINFMVR